MGRNCTYKGRKQAPSTRVRAIALLIYIICIPAFFNCCSSAEYGPEETDRYSVFLHPVYASGGSTDDEAESGIRHTDIFIFNNDALRRLDSYQRIEGSGPVKAASRKGDKIIVIIANSSYSKKDWRHINSFEGLYEETALLEQESTGYHIMTSVLEISSVDRHIYRADMERLSSGIRINSIRTDFSGREYDGEPLTDVKVYLTNVNASCMLLRHEGFRPELIVNPGFLDMSAVSGFKDTGIIYREIDEDIGEDAIYPDIILFCYPNDAGEETAGSPFTRLVIEGRIRGETYWYPITINRGDFGIASGGDGRGIGRNMMYSYDITIRRTGTKDPDIPVSLEDVTISCPVEPWEDIDSGTVSF